MARAKIPRRWAPFNSQKGSQAGRAWVAALALGLGLAFGAGPGAEAGDGRPDGHRPDKSGYHLFRPAPRETMRAFATDRPDQTETATTVDAGHFQLEMDFLNATWDVDRSGDGEVRRREWAVAPLNLKAGLLNWADLQMVLDPYVEWRIEESASGGVERGSGTGDLQTRLKMNLWGNDEGSTALAVMPYVKWPLSRSAVRLGKTEGGVILPFGWDFAEGWGLSAMSEFDFVAGSSDGYEMEFVHSIAVSRELGERLGMYVEFHTVTGTEAGFAWQGQVDVGWTFALRADLQLDLGCNFGVTESAPDFNPFVGMSVRY